jgi:ABC-type Fe3+-hydroxamate transport system substrate-binding protein
MRGGREACDRARRRDQCRDHRVDRPQCRRGTQGGLANVSIEQILVWNPDVVITIDQEFAATVRNDPSWASVKAVRDNRVHLSPKMPFGWVDFRHP